MKGSVAPVGGMGQLIDRLGDYLKTKGVSFSYEEHFKMPEVITDPIVICTSAWSAAEILNGFDDKLSAQLKTCESLSLVSVTAFFEATPVDLQGFGCLFPPPQMFTASGVLFNECIFADRSKKRSETWIFGGSLRPDLVTWSDEQIIGALVKDRERLSGSKEPPTSYEISRWPRAVPHYNVAWEKTLRELKPKTPLFLHGNYLGGLGLSRIYSRSRQLARRMSEISDEGDA